MKVFCSPPDYNLWETVLAEVKSDVPHWWSANPDGSSPHNVIAKFDERSGEITWSDPKTFKSTGEQK